MISKMRQRIFVIKSQFLVLVFIQFNKGLLGLDIINRIYWMGLLFYEDVLVLVSISKMATHRAKTSHISSSCSSMQRAISRRSRLSRGVWNVGALFVFDDKEPLLLFTLVLRWVFKRIRFCIVKCFASIIAVCGRWFSSRRSEVAALNL